MSKKISRSGKLRGEEKFLQPESSPVDCSRREFLFRFGVGTSAALLPSGLRDLAFRFPDSYSAAADSGYHLHPRYRTPRPLDQRLLKVKSGSDEFISEKYHDEIALIFAAWSESLRSRAGFTAALEPAFADSFSGFSIQAKESKVVRGSPGLEVRRMDFHGSSALGKDEFLRQLQASFSAFNDVLTADFQIIDIQVSSETPIRLRTGVRFDFVGAGTDFYREQRTGEWDLDWQDSSGRFLIQDWKPVYEMRSRSFAPIYADISEQVLGSNHSYHDQILHGADYWRTVLDGACGIDVYGHNGVSVADIDNDGLDDVYVCQPAGLPNRLYHNRGDGTFEDITEKSGVGLLDNTACALFADFSNNGHQDLIIVRAAGPLLFVNDGNGKFRETTDAFQFANPPQGTFTGAALADYDCDGWLDVYFCLYAYYQGTDQYKYPLPYYAAENGPPNFMMRNQRDGTFRDVTQETGLNKNNTRYSFCCGWGDYDGDGWPDLYVVNDFGRKNLYRNNGDGTFSDVAGQEAVEDVGAGMSVCWLDYDNDGKQDIYVADMWTAAGERISQQEVFKKDAPEEVRALYRKHAVGNSLFRNRFREAGNTGFEQATAPAGVGMGRWSWSSDSWDFDHDGFPDLYVTNGMISGSARDDLNSFFWRQVIARSPDGGKASQEYEDGWNTINELIRADGTWSGFERNVFYANNRDGTFSDVSGAVGLDFIEDGRAFALADCDGDGRQEVFLKNRNAPQLRIFKNVMEQLPPAIALRLRGVNCNRDAIGAVVTIETASGSQTRMLQAGSGFLSQHSKQLFFGLGESTGSVRVLIRWPNGVVQQLEDLAPNHTVWIEEGRLPTRTEPFKMPANKLAKEPATTIESIRRQMTAEVSIPNVVETWLLAPIAAPDFFLTAYSASKTGGKWTLAANRGKIVLLSFWSAKAPGWQQLLESLDSAQSSNSGGLRLLAVGLDEGDDGSVQAWIRNRRSSYPVLRGTEDTAAIFNILYRQMFDRHRDMTLPTSFLIDGGGQIVKVYQGAINLHGVERDAAEIPGSVEQRLAKALPFSGVSNHFGFGRNYLSYGSIFFQRGYMDQAAQSFHQALDDDHSSAEALYGLGSVYLDQQKLAEAKESFAKAIQLRSAYPTTIPNAWNNLGLMAAREGNTDAAIEYFQKALKLNPAHFVALENLGNAYRQQKRWDDARETLEKALSLNAGDAEANYSLGMVFAQTANNARAYEYLSKALVLRPGYPEALNNLGILYLRTGRRDEAVASFEESINQAPDFDQSYLNLAQVYALENQPLKARAVLLELLKRRPDNALARNALEQLAH